MKKFNFILTLLALMFVVAACEKPVEPMVDVEEPKDVSAETAVSKDMLEFVGFWTRTSEDPYENDGHSLRKYEWRFYEDSCGRLYMEQYHDGPDPACYTMAMFNYKVEDGLLYIYWYYGEDKDTPVVWNYKFKGNTLIVKSDMDERGIEYVFEKTEEPDDKLVGTWQTITVNDDNTFTVRKYSFYTPTYGMAQEVLYDSITGRMIEEYHPMHSNYGFTYSIEGDKVTIVKHNYGNGCVAKTLYFRLDDYKLYLRDSKEGIETEYSYFMPFEHNHYRE